jgi:hypothetical protein
VMSTAAARSFSRILRCARTTSRLTMMGISGSLRRRSNNQHRTSNIQFGLREFHWMGDVCCSMLVVFIVHTVNSCSS